MLEKLGSIFRKPPEFTDEQVERNKRRISKIDDARAATADRLRQEADLAEVEGRPPPYNTVPIAGNLTGARSSDARHSSSGEKACVATLVGRDGKPAVNDNWTAERTFDLQVNPFSVTLAETLANTAIIATADGWKAQWHSSVNQYYKENGHYQKRQAGESAGPRRMIPQDHPVYEMSAKEQAALSKKGVDPVTAAEFRRLSKQ